MYKFLDAEVRKVQHDLHITFIYSLNISQSLLGYISPLSTKPFCELSKKYRHFKTLAHKDRVTFMSVLRGIEIRLLYLQVSKENMTGVTDGLSNIFNFLVRQPTKYLAQMDNIAKASKFVLLGRESGVNPCVLYGIEIPGESPEQMLAVVNEYLALTDQLVAAFKRCNPASLEVEQNNSKSANAYYNFHQYICVSWVVFLFLTIAGNCSAKDSLLNNYVPVFINLSIILNLVLGIDFVMTSLGMIKNDKNQHEYLLMVLASLSPIIVRGYSWRNFHSDAALKPENMRELAEKIFYLRSGLTLEGVSAVVKDYLLENETVIHEFNAELFVEALEKEYVNEGQMQLLSVYDDDEVTHEALVAQVNAAVAELRDSKLESSSLSSNGWFSANVSSPASGMMRRTGLVNK